MAVTSTHLTTNSSTSNASSYTTASVTPTANRLVLLALTVTSSASPTPTPTITGNGLTWTQVTQTVVGARTLHLFRAMGASPTAGTVTIAGGAFTSALWQIVEFAGIDTGGTNGSAAAINPVNAKPASGTSVSVAPSPTPTAGNGYYAAVANAVQETPAPGAGWTSLTGTNQSAPTSGMVGMFAGASIPANITATWTTSAAPFVVGVEILAAGGGSTAATAAGSITLGGTATGTPPKVDTLTDNFGSSTNWTLITGGTVTGGQLVLPTTTGFAGAATVTQYSLVASSASVKLVQTGGTSVSQTHFYMDAGGGYDIRFQILGSTMYATYKVGGVESTPASVAYNPAVHRYLRLSESAGDVYWDWSTDGITWTNLNTTSWSVAGMKVAIIRPTFYSGYDGTGAAPADSIFDDFNIVPTPTAATASGAITLAGSAAGQARPTAAGAITLGATVTAPTVAAGATGTVTLSGTGTPSARPTTAGTITLTGSGTARAAATATGAIVLGGAATATQPGSTAAGSITLAGTATARAAATSSGSITLGGTATGRATATGTGAIVLNGTVTARAAATTSGAIVLGGTVTASGRATAAGLITLGGLAVGIDAGADTYHPHVSVTATLTSNGVSTATLASNGVSTATISFDAGFGASPFGDSAFGGSSTAPVFATLAGNGVGTATLATVLPADAVLTGNGVGTATLAPDSETAVLETV